jgi:spore germination cell wall hydrolase CwlJ-like protein
MPNLLTTTFPLKEPKAEAEENSAEPLVIGTEVTVDEARSRGDWMWVSGDGKEGFVHKDSLGNLQFAPPEISPAVFAEFCVEAAIQYKCNAGALIAIAWAESDGQWDGGMVRSFLDAPTGRVAPFGFTQARWDAIRAEFAAFIGSEQISFPHQQCIIAAAQARRDIEQLTALLDRDITTRDLYLAHLLDAVGAKQIQEAGPDETLDAALLPILNEDRRTVGTFLKARPELTGGDGTPVTVRTFIANCDSKLQRGLDAAAGLVAALDASEFPQVKAELPKQAGDSVEPPKESLFTPFDGPTISITATDLDALARVAHSEVAVFAKFGKEELEGGIAAVVDTIINRVAHKGFQKSIQEVIDKPKQFSAINKTGTWRLLPAAPAETARFVEDHVRARAAGKNSAIKGATFFLNPTASSASALESWGRFVVANPTAIYGDRLSNKSPRAVHFHGFAPGAHPPGAYAIQFGNLVHHFTGEGISRPVGSETGDARNIVDAALREWAFWGNSTENYVTRSRPSIKHIDNEEAYARYVRDNYCAVVNDKPSTRAISNDEYYWSAVTICYILRAAGIAGAGFNFSNNHSVYIRQAIKARKNSNKNIHYWGYRADEQDAVPVPGDLIGYPRADGLTRERALGFFAEDDEYGSHTDIVVAKRPGEIDVIGGNVSDSVTMKTIKVNASGLIADPFHNWFVVMKRQHV